MAETKGFADGNVSVVLTRNRQFLLHSDILSRNSELIDELLDESAAHPVATEEGVVIRHQLMLTPRCREDGENVPCLVLRRVQEGHRGDAAYGGPIGVEEGSGDTEVDALVHAYESVLGAFYSLPIDLGSYERDGMAHILHVARLVADVAEYLECVPVVTAAVESIILAIGQDFHVAVAGNPLVWLLLGHRVQSRAIFKEALIHGAGKYYSQLLQSTVYSLPLEVGRLVREKATIIQEQVKAADHKIAAFYPKPLQRERTTGFAEKDNIGRASYSNDILFWMALCAFRQFHTNCVLEQETHAASDMGYAFMSAVSKGGNWYMSRAQLHTFHERFPMSNKAMATVEFRVNEIKEQVKQHAEVGARQGSARIQISLLADRVGKPLMVNNSQLNLELYPVSHFTCTNVGTEDYPWLHHQRPDNNGASDPPSCDGDQPSIKQ